MKKIIGLLAAFFSFVFVFALASCGSKSGVEVEETHIATTSKITFNLTFAENENLSGGTAVPHIKEYEYDETASDHVGDYLNVDTKVTFSNDVYTSSKVTFSSLTKDTTYVFRLYVTYNAEEELLATWEVATSASGDSQDTATEITTKAQFLAMSDDPEGYYILKNDIDFGGDTIAAIFSNTSSKMFSGTFDGNNHTISNFVLGTSNTGLFNYTKNATIKNLIIDGNDSDGNELLNGDYTSGRATANMGILAGTAEATTFENITVKNASVSIKGNTSAELNVGIVAGSANKCSFKDVKVTGASINYTDLRLKVCTGLFAGSVYGNSSYKEDGTEIAVVNCSAEGKITGTLHYASSEGYAYIGGFIGDLGTSSLVKDSYSIASITLYRNETSTDSNKFGLSVGGFAGANMSGSVNVSSCAAVADITVNAGEEDSTSTLTDNVLTNYYANIGGFMGTVFKYIDKIEKSAYFKMNTGITVNAKEFDSSSNALYVKSDTVAKTYEGASISIDATALSDAVKTAVAEYNK